MTKMILRKVKRQNKHSSLKLIHFLKNQAFPFTKVFGTVKSFLNLSPSSKSTKESNHGEERKRNKKLITQINLF